MGGSVCERCGAFGDIPHQWTEGDCTLGHHTHRHATNGWLCQPCTEKWDGWLYDIVDLYAELATVLLTGSIHDDTAEHKRPKKAAGSPSPIRLAAWALFRNEVRDHTIDVAYGPAGRTETVHATYLGGNLPDIPAILQGWATTVYEHHYGPTNPDRFGTVSSAAAWLRANLNQAASSPHVDDIDAELAWVRRALRSAHGIHDPAPLGRCLTVTNGRDCGGLVWRTTQPACDRCGRVYARLDLVRLKVNEQRRKARA